MATALAGLRANEARYFKNKYDHVFTVESAAKAKKAIDWVHRILGEERDIVIASPPLEATTFDVEKIRWTYVFYESGLSINVLYPLDEPKKRGAAFKLSEGMEVPAELASFKFAGGDEFRPSKMMAGGVVASLAEPSPTPTTSVASRESSREANQRIIETLPPVIDARFTRPLITSLLAVALE